jgi:hypothetical protein
MSSVWLVHEQYQAEPFYIKARIQSTPIPRNSNINSKELSP